MKITPLPFAPNSYEARYFNEVIRALNLYFRLLSNPGPSVQSTLQLLDLPNSATGLPPGSVWHDTTDNTLKIVPASVNNKVKLVGVSTTAEAGDIGV